MGKKTLGSRATFATAALAGLSILDGTASAAPPAPAFSWTGFYVGGTAGFGWQDVHYGNPGFTGDADPSGFSAGAFVGYNFQVAPQFVLGIESGIGFTGFNETTLIGGTDIRSRTPYDYSVVGRAGFLFTPQQMFFVSGGWAGAKQEVSFPGLSESLTRSGWTVGAGFESGALIRGAHVRVEYRYTDYGTKTYFGDLPVGLSQHGIRFGISTTPEKVIYGR
jgi:outer membrane immunogenic protein